MSIEFEVDPGPYLQAMTKEIEGRILVRCKEILSAAQLELQRVYDEEVGQAALRIVEGLDSTKENRKIKLTRGKKVAKK